MFENSTVITADELTEFNIYSAKKTKRIFMIVFAVLAVVGAALMFVDWIIGGVLLLYFAIFLIVYPLQYKKTIRKAVIKQIKASKLLDSIFVMNFLFEEDCLKITETKNDEIKSKTKLDYSELVKVGENERYLFFYIGNNQGYVLDSTRMTVGTFSDLRAFLMQKTQSAFKPMKNKRNGETI